ncbi:MAG: ABC transporter permease subunit [Planctomycetaceae bacterium]
MSLLRFIPELPLLRRELTELSARKRTYVIRFIGAIVLLGWVFYVMNVVIQRAVGAMPTISPSQRAQSMLGMGGLVIHSIVPSLFHFIQILMPALVCGSIAMEKERNTLGTLFVTRLSPLTIVLEKFGSRLIPMFTFLLLTFPLLAFAYSFGGVDTQLVFSAAWLLVAECMCYAAVGLLCSAWFGTTVSAFIGAYVLTGVFVVITQVLGFRLLSPFCIWQMLLTPYSLVNGPMRVFSDSILNLVAQWGLFSACFWLSLPSILFVVVCLMMTRFLLFRRAFVGQSSFVLRIFRRIDRFFTDLNNRTTGGVVLVQDGESLPAFDPVAWRERTKKSLGKARYLIRILVLIEGPVLFMCLLSITMSESSNSDVLRVLLGVVWGLAFMVLVVKASTVISAERSRETLDALLSTPITSSQLLREKVQGMRRMMIVLATPILTVHLTLVIMYGSFWNNSGTEALCLLLYLVSSAIATATLMHTVAWLSIIAGLRCATQAKSVTFAVILIGAWMFVSYTVLGSPQGYYSDTYYARDFHTEAFVKCLFRHDGWICANEGLLTSLSTYRGYGSMMIWQYLGQNTARATLSVFFVGLVHLGWFAAIRYLVLKLAPWLLNRRDEVPSNALQGRRFPHLDDGSPVLPLTDLSANLHRSRG